MSAPTLEAWLKSRCVEGDAASLHTARLVQHFAQAAIQVRKSVNEGALGAAFAAARGANSDGDVQKELDVHADDLFLDAARRAGVGCYGSEELPHPVLVDPTSPIAVAIDPLDGSSNIDTNVSIGSIFSVLPFEGDCYTAFLRPGTHQIAAGFFIYGPQLALVLTMGSGTSIFVLSSRMGSFVEAYKDVVIAPDAREFAINASNYRHWDESIRLYVDDCLTGTEGPREKDFNMRWIASLVADAYRILVRGGVFLYPRDGRKGYSGGRLRLVYEANPIAMIMEQAGGAAHDGYQRILDIPPADLHQRTPLFFGSKREVGKIQRYLSDPSAIGNRHPLFGNRGLFRA